MEGRKIINNLNKNEVMTEPIISRSHYIGNTLIEVVEPQMTPEEAIEKWKIVGQFIADLLDD